MDREWIIKGKKDARTTPRFQLEKLERFYWHLLMLRRWWEECAGGGQESRLGTDYTYKYSEQFRVVVHAGYVIVDIIGVKL